MKGVSIAKRVRLLQDQRLQPCLPSKGRGVWWEGGCASALVLLKDMPPGAADEGMAQQEALIRRLGEYLLGTCRLGRPEQLPTFIA
jgi:hypothetical protein